ncbi:hypothetical protein JY97_07530 [Alkalispirochaeta odontotermitis]|nr:hypothetical protein JY97_07530 [Alkalispirochaeta odontotermitis]CAB1083693.1 Gliding motility-associated ABC transporter substrate-binding protein GldG [Olavius algarvensis Delta 1 endosymbiont]
MQTFLLAILGLAAQFAGFIFGLIMPGLRYYAWGILALGSALLATAVILEFKRVRGALASRRGRFGLSTIVKVSLFGGIILIINAISVGTYHRFDFTGLAQFTLTSQTKEILAELNQPVEILNFYSPSVPVTISSYAKNLTTEYRNQTDELTVRNIDPDLHPDQARQYQVDQAGALYGVTVFVGRQGQRRVLGPRIAAEAEHAFTSAILEVTGTRQRKVYFLTGHGEHSIHSDYDSARSGLRDNLFQVDQLDLKNASAVPADAAVVILAGPQQPLSKDEQQVLQNYLANDGRLLILWNPDPPQWLRRFLASWWLDIADGTVVDSASHVAPNPHTLLIPGDRNSFKLPETYFPGAAPVFPRGAIPDGAVILPLIWTSAESWIEKEFSLAGKPVFNEQVDRKGPLPIGALVSTTPVDNPTGPEGTRLVLIGDSDFAANRHFRNGNNGDLFLTAVNWLTAGGEIISVDRKALVTRRLLLDPEQARFLHISSMGLLPLILLLTGVYVWWRRR